MYYSDISLGKVMNELVADGMDPNDTIHHMHIPKEDDSKLYVSQFNSQAVDEYNLTY